MSENYKVRNPNGLYFITLTIVNWIDLLTRPRYKHIIIQSLIHCHYHKGLRIHAYVLMSNHIHLIVSSNDENLLFNTIRDFKRHTSRSLIKSVKDCQESRKDWLLERFEKAANKIKRNSMYKVWQDGFHPVELINNYMVSQKLNYSHRNPVVQEVVVNAEDYKYSSAARYANATSILPITKI